MFTKQPVKKKCIEVINSIFEPARNKRRVIKTDKRYGKNNCYS